MKTKNSALPMMLYLIISNLYKNIANFFDCYILKKNIMYKSLKITILSILIFLNNPIFAQESMIPNISYSFLEKLIIAAKTNYPKLKTFEKKIDIAKLNVKKAQLDWLSILTFSYVYSPSNATTIITPSLNGYQFAVSTSIGTVLQKPNLIKNAKKELEISKLNEDEYDLNLTTLVKQKYFLYVQQLTILNWKIKALEDAENTLKQIKYKFEKGEESFDNYNHVLGTFTSSVQSKIESEGAFLNAKSSLEEIIGSKLDDIK